MHLLHNAIMAAWFSIYPGTGETLLERKPPRLVAVALANKFAHCMALYVSGGSYNRPFTAMPT
jgi:hypothetical protein